MIKVGITGQSGFIGSHLFNFLNLKKETITVIPFRDDYFEDSNKLREFAGSCDAIIHLAALNRHHDPSVIYSTNILLVRKLIQALDESGNKPHVLFSSSTQEENDNPYGKSKSEGRILLEQWGARVDARVTGLVIPNVFGPFGNPFYNSVVATFCYQLTHDQKPSIIIDSSLRLIYVNELVQLFYDEILNPDPNLKIRRTIVRASAEKPVSEILSILEGYNNSYLVDHTIPELRNPFEISLFNTLRSYIDNSTYYPVSLKKNSDQRGIFVETVKSLIGGQFSFSSTRPGITRGNHFHMRKIERFIVIKGEALIEMRRIGTSEILRFGLSGEKPSFVDMPVWYTHNITNVGREELLTLFWINEFYDPEDPDTFFESV